MSSLKEEWNKTRIAHHKMWLARHRYRASKHTNKLLELTAKQQIKEESR